MPLGLLGCVGACYIPWPGLGWLTACTVCCMQASSTTVWTAAPAPATAGSGSAVKGLIHGLWIQWRHLQQHGAQWLKAGCCSNGIHLSCGRRSSSSARRKTWIQMPLARKRLEWPDSRPGFYWTPWLVMLPRMRCHRDLSCASTTAYYLTWSSCEYIISYYLYMFVYLRG